MKLSIRLKELRMKNKLSVSEVAEFVGVSSSTYREWEYGRSISGEPYMKIAEIFNVSLKFLLTGEDDRGISDQIQKLERLLFEADHVVKNIKIVL